MFGSTSGLGHGNIFEPYKQYISPHDRTKKKRRKKRIFSLGKNIKKSGEIQNMLGVR